MTITEAVAARINDLLKKKKMTRKQLEEKSNLSQSTIANIFRGRATSVTLSTLAALCHGFGMSMSDFLDCKYFKRRK